MNDSESKIDRTMMQNSQSTIRTRQLHRILYVSTVSWVNLTITILPDPTDELLLKQQAGPPNISHLFNLVHDWREHFRKKSNLINYNSLFLTCCLTYWTSWCLKESHHLTHRGRTCPFALLGRAKCLFLQVKCYSVLCAFKLLRTEWKEKGKLCKFCKGSTLFPHCTNLSCYIARGCFLQGNCQSLRLSIYPIYFLCCA